MYSKLPPEDEWLIYSKHVQDIYWNKFKKKVHLVGSYYANLSRCTVNILSKKDKLIFFHLRFCTVHCDIITQHKPKICTIF